MILDEIVASNRQLLEEKKRRVPLAEMRRLALASPPPLDFASALSGQGIHLIAEIKKASPSAGVIRADFDPVEIAGIYANSGAAAISVLTEPRYFQGDLSYLMRIKSVLGDKRVPLLRKDFLTDSYEIYESRLYGADAVLLIVAILTPQKLSELLGLSHELGMSCLVEVHNEKETEIALKSGARIIGINNRDLTTFAVDLATTERLRSLIPPGRIVVSESGIRSREDIERLKRLGVNGVLIGEALMAAQDIAAMIREIM